MSPLKPATNEIRALTGLRGVAAIYVVVVHYLGPSPAQALSSPLTTLLGHGSIAVDLFFVLSGFVMALNYSHMFSVSWSIDAHLKFLGRRIARVYPLYFVATVAGFLLVLRGWVEYNGSWPLGVAVLFNAFMVQAWGLSPSIDMPAWSISAEWAAYLLFPVLLVPTLFRRPFFAWLSALICVMVLGALCALPSMHSVHNQGFIDYWTPAFAFPLLRCLPEFVLGILAFRILATPFGVALGSSRWFAPTICTLTFALLAIPRTDLAIVLLFPLLVVSLASGTHLPGRLLASPPAQLAGVLSYSIYLTHVLLVVSLVGTRALARSHGLPHAATYGALAATMLTFAISYVAYRTIEVPGRRWLRSILEKETAEKRSSLPPCSDELVPVVSNG
jgi:peptidoglycan/LPS O-acetylase OafA/YrhL